MGTGAWGHGDGGCMAGGLGWVRPEAWDGCGRRLGMGAAGGLGWVGPEAWDGCGRRLGMGVRPASLTAIGDDPDAFQGCGPGCEPGLIPIDRRYRRRQP